MHTMHEQLELEISLDMLFLFVFFSDAPFITGAYRSWSYFTTKYSS